MHRRKFLANLLWSAGVVLSGSKCRGVIENDNKSNNDKGEAALSNTGTIIEPEHEIPVIAETDVLVIGGGPAGVAAAISANRAGASTILVERYNHLGGLWTGGLVLPLLSTHALDKNKQYKKDHYQLHLSSFSG